MELPKEECISNGMILFFVLETRNEMIDCINRGGKHEHLNFFLVNSPKKKLVKMTWYQHQIPED